MTRHVTERAGAEVEPSAPVERMINPFLERARGRRSEPKIPVHISGHRIFALRPSDSLRPDRAIRPYMNFPRRADQPRLNHFDGAAQSVFGAALIAHLRDHFLPRGEVTKMARFKNRLRQRLLAVHMFAQLHRCRGGNGMEMVWGRNGDS